MSQLLSTTHKEKEIEKGLQISEWDYVYRDADLMSSRLFLQKNARDVFTVKLKREIVENDRRLKMNMKIHRISLNKQKNNLDQIMRKDRRPFVCFRGNILSRYGKEFNDLPSSMNKHQVLPRLTSNSNCADTIPITVVDNEVIILEENVKCDRCNKVYKENENNLCRFHVGPVIAVFGGMCQSCGRLDHTIGCASGYHTREPKNKISTA